MSGTKWRLLEYHAEDPKMNLAIDEALLRNRQEESSIDTIRLWQNSDSVVLGSAGNIESDIHLEACNRHQISVTRSACIGPTVYHDDGNLNFTIILSERSFPLSKNLLNTYKLFYKAVTQAFQNFSVETQIDDYGQALLLGNGRISEAGVRFFQDLMMFHGTIYLNTNLEIMKDVLRRRGTTVTSLSREIGAAIEMAKSGHFLAKSLEAALNTTLKEDDITDQEWNLAQRLYDVKHSKNDWIIGGKEPLSLKDVLIEVYVAFPPTSMCKLIMNTIDAVASKHEERVEVRTWMRGAGLGGRGCAGVTMSAGLRKASKESIIPAVIINGDIVFERMVPSEVQLTEAISKLLT